MVTSGYALLPATRAPTYSATKAGLSIPLRRRSGGSCAALASASSRYSHRWFRPRALSDNGRCRRERCFAPVLPILRCGTPDRQGKVARCCPCMCLAPLAAGAAVLQGHGETLFGLRSGPKEGSRSFRQCYSAHLAQRAVGTLRIGAGDEPVGLRTDRDITPPLASPMRLAQRCRNGDGELLSLLPWSVESLCRRTLTTASPSGELPSDSTAWRDDSPFGVLLFRELQLAAEAVVALIALPCRAIASCPRPVIRRKSKRALRPCS